MDGNIKNLGHITGNITGTGTVTGSLSNPAQRAPSRSYNDLFDKPKIEHNELIGDKSFEELGLGDITPQEIDELIFG